jgi:hypothetical protein
MDDTRMTRLYGVPVVGRRPTHAQVQEHFRPRNCNRIKPKPTEPTPRPGLWLRVSDRDHESLVRVLLLGPSFYYLDKEALKSYPLDVKPMPRYVDLSLGQAEIDATLTRIGVKPKE